MERLYKTDDFEGFSKLLKKCFFMRKDDYKDIISWKFFKRGLKNMIYLAFYENQIIGQYNNSEIFVNIDGNKITAYQCLDMCVDPKHRGKGIISRLSKQVYSNISKKDFTIGFSNKKGIQVDKHAKNYGYQILGDFQKIFVFNLFGKVDFSFKQIESFDELQDIPISKICGIYKDKEYLNWRYVEKPNNRYKVFKVFDKQKDLGYVVLKLDELNAYILDFEFIDGVDNNQIIEIIKKISLKYGKLISMFYICENNYWKKFFDKKIHFKLNYGEKHYFTIKIHNKNSIYIDLITNINNWKLTMGDII